MNREFVFVGGVADGKRRVFYEAPEVIEFPVMKPTRVESPCESKLLVESHFTIERYARRTLSAGPTYLVFYAVEGLSDFAALGKLIDGYKVTPQ